MSLTILWRKDRKTLVRKGAQYQLCERGESLCEAVLDVTDGDEAICCPEPAALRVRLHKDMDWLYLCWKHCQPEIPLRKVRELLGK